MSASSISGGYEPPFPLRPLDATAVTYARLRPPCPSPTLLGAGEDTRSVTSRHARSRVETHRAGQAGVDDYPHTFDRQTGFRTDVASTIFRTGA